MIHSLPLRYCCTFIFILQYTPIKRYEWFFLFSSISRTNAYDEHFIGKSSTWEHVKRHLPFMFSWEWWREKKNKKKDQIAFGFIFPNQPFIQGKTTLNFSELFWIIWIILNFLNYCELFELFEFFNTKNSRFLF